MTRLLLWLSIASIVGPALTWPGILGLGPAQQASKEVDEYYEQYKQEAEKESSHFTRGKKPKKKLRTQNIIDKSDNEKGISKSKEDDRRGNDEGAGGESNNNEDGRYRAEEDSKEKTKGMRNKTRDHKRGNHNRGASGKSNNNENRSDPVEKDSKEKSRDVGAKGESTRPSWMRTTRCTAGARHENAETFDDEDSDQAGTNGIDSAHVTKLETDTETGTTRASATPEQLEKLTTTVKTTTKLPYVPPSPQAPAQQYIDDD